MSICNDAKISYGCLFCRTGNEARLASVLQRDFPEVQFVAAQKMRKRRSGGKLEDESVLLFPGYLFFQADAGFPVHDLMRMEDAYKVLQSSAGKWQLCGADERFVRQVFEQQGVIGYSKAYFEGDRIRIVEGMLKEHEGRILRINRRMQTAQVSIGVCGQETVWLGFELIDKDEPAIEKTESADAVSADEGV